MDTSGDLKKLVQIEASYPALEASIADIEGQIKEHPTVSGLKAQWRSQRTKLSERRSEAEKLRIQLGKPTEEEDPDKTA